MSAVDDDTAELIREIQEVDTPSAETDEEIAVRRIDAEHRYVAALGDRIIATVLFREEGATTVIESTTVARAFRGRGLAADFIADVLDDLRETGTRIVSECPVVTAFAGTVPAYAGLLS